MWIAPYIDKVNTFIYDLPMDKHYEYGDIAFIWDERKASRNFKKHGVLFEEAVTVFFDPFFVLTDADRHEESRDAVIGLDASARLLFVVHIEQCENHIRLISARRATLQEEILYAEGKNGSTFDS